MLIGADVGAVQRGLFCLGFRQLTCWRDSLTFSGSPRPSSLIETSLRETSTGAATLALSVTYHAHLRGDTFGLAGTAGDIY